ncbi:mucin-12-like [Scylla paramamosain]|uniref:mucin-12-like n=1 Tax=Scylla paramamosain TaxID=85552 RepID=UPI0030829015
MPGLRSLVARRRSSLTSPPYTVQRNTPSPSLSDTSDHATTPHNSEGGESPMTEREGGLAEVQETEGQDVSDVQGADGSRAQNSQFFNGEDAEKKDGCSGVSVGNSQQEKSLLDTGEVEDPGGELHTSTTSGIHVNEEKECLLASDVGVVSDGSSTTVLQNDLRVGEVPYEDSEQTTGQASANVKSEEQSHIDTEVSPPESDTASQGAEPLVSEETNIYKEEEHLETEETPEVKESVDSAGERLLPGEETQEDAKESCNVDVEKIQVTVTSDPDVRDKASCETESLGADGDGDGDEDEQTNDVSMTSMENENQENDESHFQKVDLFRETAIPEEKGDPCVVKQGANEEAKPTDMAEGSDQRGSESFSQSDMKPSENVETSMVVSEETQVPGTGKALDPEYTVEDTGNTEEFSGYVVKENDEYTTGEREGEGKENTVSCDDSSLGKETEPVGRESGEDDGRDMLGKPDGSYLASNEGSEERDGNYGGGEMLEVNLSDYRDVGNVEDRDDSVKELQMASSACSEGVVNYSETVNMDVMKETKRPNENVGESENSEENKPAVDSAEVICKSESPPSNKKADGDCDTNEGSADNKNILNKLIQKNSKGGKKCSDLSAMEIESTLASRGVTIVRRVVDNKESANRGSESNTVKKETGTSIKPVGKGVFAKALQSPFTGTSVSGSGISVSLQPSLSGQANSPTPKDLYKSINARGTHIQSTSKINPALLNRKGSFQLTRGVSIHYNPKSAATNMNVRGNTVYPNPRGVGAVGSRGPRMYANPRVPGPQTLRGLPANIRPRGATLPQTRRGTPQANLRGPVAPVNTRGMGRGQRYAGPRGGVPRGAVPQPRAASVTTTNLRGVGPQRFRGGMTQHQPRLPGLPPQGKPTEGVLTSKAGETLQSRSTTAPPQAKYLKTSLDSRPGDAALHSNLNSDKMNMPLHSKGLGLSTQPRPPDTLHSPQPGSAEVSPQSRTSQFSPQTLIGGIQPQSEYGGPSAQPRAMEQSPQSVHAMSSASATTSQPGSVSFTSQPVSASHPTLPSSSHHLSQMNMMAPQTSAMGLAPHSGASRLPPHSSGGYLAQPTSLGSSSQVMPSHMATSDRFSSNITSAGFPSIPNSDYLGRPSSEMFPSYNNPGEYTPHSSASGFPHMNSGNFGLQSTSAGFHAQTNLVGFPAQGDPCGYPQHASSSEFPHNPAGVARQTGSDNFSSHPNCSNFPVPGNPGTYPPIPCSEPYSTPTNPGTFRENTDLFNYTGQRDFMMHTGSREFSHYSSSNQMTSQLQPLPATGHRDLPMSQSPRDLPLQNCNQNISMSSNGGNTTMNNIIGDQFASYGESLGHSTYQEIPVNARANPNTVPLAPSFRDTEVQQNYRDTATPHYNNYREPNTQEGLRTPQLHSAYRDLPLDPNMDLQTQSAHSGFKDQQQSARYQEDGIISRYLEQSVLNYPETGSLNSCREQPVPNFGSPASHTSPSEQINQMNFPETMNDTSSRQHLMPGLGEPMNYGGYRGPMEFNSPNPNLQESLNYVPDCRDASNIDQVAKSVADSMYKDHIPVSSYNVNSHHLSLEGVQSDMKFKEKDMNYSETAILPSFTESFDPSSEISGKKDGSSNLPHFRGSSDVSYQRNLPEYTNPATPFENHGGDASTSATKDFSYSCLSDSKNSGPRESPVYPGQRGYVTPSGDSYSSVQSCSPDQQYISGSGNNFQAKSDFHIPGDSLVPPDKGILECPISQGSSTITSTNSIQSDPSGRSVPDASVSNPETNISSSKVSTSADHVQENNGQNFPTVTSDKDAKESEKSNFLGSVEGRKLSRDPGSDSPTKSPGSHSVGSLEKFPVGMSPNKSDSGSPNTQDRIVIKMKLLHSSSSAEEDVHSAENINTTELGLTDKSSIKYNLAKYTCWTIDSIINGREDLGNEEMLDQENDCEIEQLDGREEKITSMTNCSKKTRKRLNSEICEDSKDTNLDTNKNFMKKSLKITISNPMRNKVPSKDDDDEGKVEVKKEDLFMDGEKIVEDCVKVQSLSNVKEERGSGEQKPESQLQYSSRKGKVGSGKSPSPTPSGENCNSSVSGVQPDCEGRKCSKGSEASAGGDLHGAVNDHLVTSDVKKCSIVIKRIYKNDNYSCYSSSLCDKKTVLNIDDGTQRRSKRRAAVEASERCHKTLRSLDTCDAKSGKVSLAGVLNKNKDILSVNLTTNKTIINQIPQCSVLLYDVFMNHRINQMVCPGCSRHYDSSDSVQVNMNKATISLLCSSCQWLVVKDVHPQEVDSLVPS